MKAVHLFHLFTRSDKWFISTAAGLPMSNMWRVTCVCFWGWGGHCWPLLRISRDAANISIKAFSWKAAFLFWPFGKHRIELLSFSYLSPRLKTWNSFRYNSHKKEELLLKFGNCSTLTYLLWGAEDILPSHWWDVPPWHSIDIFFTPLRTQGPRKHKHWLARCAVGLMWRWDRFLLSDFRHISPAG